MQTLSVQPTNTSKDVYTLSPISKVFFGEEYLAPLTLVEDISKDPRYYQANSANAVIDYLIEGWTRIGVKSPTGTGKTLITKLIALSLRLREHLGIESGKKLRVLYVANKHRLNRQAEEEYAENDSVELIVHSAMSKIPQNIIDSGWDITFMDECHHEAMMSIQKTLDKMTHVPLIGFTADDNRGDGLLLKFERFHVAISEHEASKRGFTEKVGVNTIVDLGKTDKSDLTNQLMTKYHNNMGNTIIFLRTEKEARKVFKHIRYTLGLKVAILDSKSNEKDMDKALDRLSTGEIQFLVNCQKVGEGVDTANVTDVILARQFNSAAEKKQYIGRAIRPDSPCAVWEFTNPLVDSVIAKHVVGITKYERLINLVRGQWNEAILTGEDLTWGQMSKLRAQPVATKLTLNIAPSNDSDINDTPEKPVLSRNTISLTRTNKRGNTTGNITVMTKKHRSYIAA